MMAQARHPQRPAATVPEMAILLPFPVFLFLVAIDFCRVFYYTVAVENCARNGALWASDSFAQAESPYASATAAARADFPEAVRDRLVVSDPAPVVLQGGADY